MAPSQSFPQLVPRSNANPDSCQTDSDCTHRHCPLGSASCLGYGAPSVSDNGQKCVASAFVETRTLTMIQDVPVYELVMRKGVSIWKIVNRTPVVLDVM